MQRIATVTFWLAACFALAMAIITLPAFSPIKVNDKIQHLVVFAMLTTLAVIAYPGARWTRIFLGLIFFGGLIELIQSIPSLRRDAEWLDWAADTLAVAVTLAIIALVRRLLRVKENEI